MERTVKSRLVKWHQANDDGSLVERVARDGSVLSTDTSGDESGVIYGVPQEVIEGFDSGGHLLPLVSEQPEEGDEGADWEDLATWQIAERIKREALTENDILAIVFEHPGLAAKFIQAEAEVTGGDPREGVVEGIAHILASQQTEEVEDEDTEADAEPEEEGEPQSPAAEPGSEEEPGAVYHPLDDSGALEIPVVLDRDEEEDDEPEIQQVDADRVPKGNASKAEWAEFLTGLGYDPGDRTRDDMMTYWDQVKESHGL